MLDPKIYTAKSGQYDPCCSACEKENILYCRVYVKLVTDNREIAFWSNYFEKAEEHFSRANNWSLPMPSLPLVVSFLWFFRFYLVLFMLNPPIFQTSAKFPSLSSVQVLTFIFWCFSEILNSLFCLLSLSHYNFPLTFKTASISILVQLLQGSFSCLSASSRRMRNLLWITTWFQGYCGVSLLITFMSLLFDFGRKLWKEWLRSRRLPNYDSNQRFNTW